jgi:hypothetical protein
MSLLPFCELAWVLDSLELKHVSFVSCYGTHVLISIDPISIRTISKSNINRFGLMIILVHPTSSANRANAQLMMINQMQHNV